MKKWLTALTAVLLAGGAFAQLDAGEYTFSNAEGKTLTDRIMKYDPEAQTVLLEQNGKVPFDTFSEKDQAYILHWNQVNGFMSTMRFKLSVEKDRWGSMKHEQTVTPYFMDALLIPGKKTPNHNVVMAEDLEEYTALYLQAEGFSLKIRNQNLFPIENIVVESKVFYEQETYITPDSLFVSSEDEYSDTVTTNKVRYISETIPIIITREEVILHSECAIIIDQQIERTLLTTTSGEDDGDDVIIEGLDEFEDHNRRRKGRVHGAWFRVGIKGLDGKTVWREITSPSSLDDKVTWEGFIDDDEDEEEKEEDAEE